MITGGDLLLEITDSDKLILNMIMGVIYYCKLWAPDKLIFNMIMYKKGK